MLSFLQSQEYKSCCTIQTKGPSGQSSVPTVARDKCVGKSNKRKQTKSIWPSSPNGLLKPPLFSGWGFPELDIICSFNSCQWSSLLKYS